MRVEFSSFKMFKVNTLEEICAQLIVEQGLVIHPVNCNLTVHPIDTRLHLPENIYSYIWHLQSLKNMHEKNVDIVEKYLEHSIDYLEFELDDVEEQEKYWSDIWSKVSDELKKMNAPNEYDMNPPSAPPMLFFQLYCKATAYRELVDIMEAFVDRKWEQREENYERKEKWFKSDSEKIVEVDVNNLDDDEDREYMYLIDTIQEEIENNQLIVDIVDINEE